MSQSITPTATVGTLAPRVHLRNAAPTATVAMIATEILKSAHPLEPGSDFQLARDGYLTMKAKGHDMTPYSWHRHELGRAVSLAWEIVEMVEEMRPDPKP